MRIKSFKSWYFLGLFCIWMGTMFFPATINQGKLYTSFYVNKSRENFFYLLFNQTLPYTLILVLLLTISVIGIYKKSDYGKYFAFASFTLYVSVFIVNIPVTVIFNSVSSFNDVLAGISRFWTFYGSGYIISVLVGVILLLGIFLSSLSSGQKNC